MAKRIEASGINAYYGAFKAIEDINMVIEPKSVTALIGPSGCGKSTFIRSINRMHEVLPGARVEGKLTIDAQNIYGRDVDVTAVRRIIVTHNMQQAARVSDRTAFFSIEKTGDPGRLIEYDETTKIFTNPSVKKTEDYITGRFG